MASERLRKIYPVDGREPKANPHPSDRYFKYVADDDIVFVRSNTGLYHDTYDNFVTDVADISGNLDPFPAEWDEVFWSNDPKVGHYYKISGKRYAIPDNMNGQFNQLVTRVTNLKDNRDQRDVDAGEPPARTFEED